MFISQINPVLLKIGAIEIRYYGLIYAIGIAITYFFLKYLAKQRKLPITKDDIADFLFFGIIGLVVFARLFYIIFYNLNYYFDNPLKVFAVWEGGLSWHGGLVGLIIVALIFCNKKKISFWEFADLTVIPLSVCLMLGRIGNFINSELYGRLSNLPWAVKFQTADGFRHPSQLYESFKNLVIFSVLWNIKDRKLPKGTMFSIFLILFSALRFFIEFFRQPDAQVGFLFEWMTMGQILNIPVFIAGIFLLAYFNFHKSYKRRKNKQ